MPRLNIKLLSINRAYQGRRFRTPEYDSFEKECLYKLPKLTLPDPPFEIHYQFGFSNKLSDLLNPEKVVSDVLCKKYGFDDRYIFRMVLEKEIVPKGEEYFEFEILHYNNI